ncbi:MAG TPA: hypothetical protein VMP08_22215 [Anaerolineae bacterium]|nr:hypothetical protein [Anaerolineae bacterium]
MGTQTSTEPTTTSAKAGRKGWVVVGVTAVITAAMVLIGGALVSGVLATSGRGGLFNREPGERPNFQIVPAAELPTSQPNVRGVVAQLNDTTISMEEREGFGPNESQGNNVPQVEVATTYDTVFYHDITRFNLNEGAPSGSIQQKLEAGSLAGLKPNSRITVWGDPNSQPLLAKIVVYADPVASRQP